MSPSDMPFVANVIVACACVIVATALVLLGPQIASILKDCFKWFVGAPRFASRLLYSCARRVHAGMAGPKALDKLRNYRSELGIEVLLRLQARSRAHIRV